MIQWYYLYLHICPLRMNWSAFLNQISKIKNNLLKLNIELIHNNLLKKEFAATEHILA